jgi:hypothetical protein
LMQTSESSWGEKNSCFQGSSTAKLSSRAMPKSSEP